MSIRKPTRDSVQLYLKGLLLWSVIAFFWMMTEAQSLGLNTHQNLTIKLPLTPLHRLTCQEGDLVEVIVSNDELFIGSVNFFHFQLEQSQAVLQEQYSQASDSLVSPGELEKQQTVALVKKQQTSNCRYVCKNHNSEITVALSMPSHRYQYSIKLNGQIIASGVHYSPNTIVNQIRQSQNMQIQTYGFQIWLFSDSISNITMSFEWGSEDFVVLSTKALKAKLYQNSQSEDSELNVVNLLGIKGKQPFPYYTFYIKEVNGEAALIHEPGVEGELILVVPNSLLLGCDGSNSYDADQRMCPQNEHLSQSEHDEISFYCHYPTMRVDSAKDKVVVSITISELTKIPGSYNKLMYLLVMKENPMGRFWSQEQFQANIVVKANCTLSSSTCRFHFRGDLSPGIYFLSPETQTKQFIYLYELKVNGRVENRYYVMQRSLLYGLQDGKPEELNTEIEPHGEGMIEAVIESEQKIVVSFYSITVFLDELPFFLGNEQQSVYDSKMSTVWGQGQSNYSEARFYVEPIDPDRDLLLRFWWKKLEDFFSYKKQNSEADDAEKGLENYSRFASDWESSQQNFWMTVKLKNAHFVHPEIAQVNAPPRRSSDLMNESASIGLILTCLFATALSVVALAVLWKIFGRKLMVILGRQRRTADLVQMNEKSHKDLRQNTNQVEISESEESFPESNATSNCSVSEQQKSCSVNLNEPN